MPNNQMGEKSFFGINFEEILKGRFNYIYSHIFQSQQYPVTFYVKAHAKPIQFRFNGAMGCSSQCARQRLIPHNSTLAFW